MFRQATMGERNRRERVKDERLMEDGDGDVTNCNYKVLASQFNSRLMRRRNSCQTVNFRLSSEGQKGVAAHWKGAKRRPCKACGCQLAPRPEDEGPVRLNWRSTPGHPWRARSCLACMLGISPGPCSLRNKRLGRARGLGRRWTAAATASCCTAAAVRRRSHARNFSGRRPTSNIPRDSILNHEPYACQLNCARPSVYTDSHIRRLFLYGHPKTAPATALVRALNDPQPGDNGRRDVVHAGSKLSLPSTLLL